MHQTTQSSCGWWFSLKVIRFLAYESAFGLFLLPGGRPRRFNVVIQVDDLAFCPDRVPSAPER
jgi:hypothetical protein